MNDVCVDREKNCLLKKNYYDALLARHGNGVIIDVDYYFMNLISKNLRESQMIFEERLNKNISDTIIGNIYGCYRSNTKVYFNISSHKSRNEKKWINILLKNLATHFADSRGEFTIIIVNNGFVNFRALSKIKVPSDIPQESQLRIIILPFLKVVQPEFNFEDRHKPISLSEIIKKGGVL